MEQILAKALEQDAAHLAAEEKQSLLARLLARLAHEIRNPLSSLDIHVQLLEEDLAQVAPADRERLAGRFEIIHGELHRLENLVRQFLRLAGPSALELESVDLSRLLGHVCDLLRPEAAGRGIEIRLQVAPGLPVMRADSGQLTQALLNLVINAIQAMDRGGRIEVSAGPGREPGFVRVEVGDTGPGVPPGALTTIFEPFFTTKPEGSGLGLWIAQQIVLAHGGAIEASNGPGGGAVFALTLPVEASQKPDG